MAGLFELTAELRTNLGKGENRRLRRLNSKLPAVVYGAGKAPESIMLTQHQFGNALKNEAFYSHILTLNVAGKPEKVVLKALQRHPSKPFLLHADFLRVSATEKLTMNIPLHFINEDIAPGVKLEGGVISHMQNEVEVRCLPGDLPEFIQIDAAEMKMGDSVHLSDLKLPKGVEIVALAHEDDRMVASLHMPHVIEEPEEEVAPSAEVPVVGEEEAAAGEGENKSEDKA